MQTTDTPAAAGRPIPSAGAGPGAAGAGHEGAGGKVGGETPFGLSLSKSGAWGARPSTGSGRTGGLRANGGLRAKGGLRANGVGAYMPFGLSLSKPLSWPFDRLRTSGGWAQDERGMGSGRTGGAQGERGGGIHAVRAELVEAVVLALRQAQGERGGLRANVEGWACPNPWEAC